MLIFIIISLLSILSTYW